MRKAKPFISTKLVLLLFSLLAPAWLFGQENYEWNSVKIGGGGFATGLVAHPTEPNLVYARTDGAGLYRWNPSNESWTQLITADRMPGAVLEYPDQEISGKAIGNGTGRYTVYATNSVALDPQDPDVLFVAAGNARLQAGVFLKSTDRGESFSLLELDVPVTGNNQSSRTYGERLAVDPNNSNVVYYGAQQDGSVYRNFQAGEGAWEQIPNSVLPFGRAPFGATAVVFDAQSGTNAQGRTNRIYASVGDGSNAGVYVSENAGGSWSKLPFPNAFFARDMQIKEGALYAASSIGSASPGLYRYTPGQGVSDITSLGQ